MPKSEPTEEEQAEEITEEIDELSEQVALDSILSEERHDEVMEGLEVCQQRLERLTNETGENPQVARELGELRQEVIALRQAISSITPLTQTPSNSPNQNGGERDAREGQTMKPTSENGGEEPKPPAVPKRPRFRRV
jgi:hypothetical protein